MMPSYQHTQRGPWYWLLLVFAALELTLAATTVGKAPLLATGILTSVGLLLVAISFSFRELTVEVGQEQIEIRFGPLPLMRSRVRIAEIESVSTSQSTVLDGWGIHWLPGRGWTYNIWGFDCVELKMASRVIRIGTDEPLELAQAIEAQRSERQAMRSFPQ